MKQPRSRDGRAPQSRNPFTPADNPGTGLWFTSDPVKIAATLGLVDAAPFVLQQEDQAGLDDGLFGPSGTRSDVVPCTLLRSVSLLEAPWLVRVFFWGNY